MNLIGPRDQQPHTMDCVASYVRCEWQVPLDATVTVCPACGTVVRVVGSPLEPRYAIHTVAVVLTEGT